MAAPPRRAPKTVDQHRQKIESARAPAELMGEVLRERAASAEVAALAPQVALVCYNAGREIAAGDPAALAPNVAAAFDRLGIASG